MQRREFLSTFAAAGVAAAVQDQPKIQRKGRIKQGLMRTNFGANSPLSFDDQCKVAARLGCYGFDLINPPDWPILKKYGLVPTMGPTGGVTRSEEHTSELQSHVNLVCRLLLEKKK